MMISSELRVCDVCRFALRQRHPAVGQTAPSDTPCACALHLHLHLPLPACACTCLHLPPACNCSHRKEAKRAAAAGSWELGAATPLAVPAF